MRTLPATLEAAQQAGSRQPHVTVEVLDHFAGVARPSLARLYTGGEPDGPHHARLAGDGSLIRVRVDPGNGKLYTQRSPSPGPGSDFSGWTFLTNTALTAGLALAARGSVVRLFYRDPTFSDTIRQRVSTDYGATWGPEENVITIASGVVEYLATAIAPSGTVTIFYATDGNTVYAMQDSGAGWSNPVAWSNQVSDIKGMDCDYSGDWNLVLAGQATSGEYKVWSCIYGDGSAQAAGTWSPLREVTTSASDSQISFQWPFVGQPDVYRLFCIEMYSGNFTYSRPTWSHLQAGSAFADNRWREPVPFDLSSTYGVALTGDAATSWLSTPSGVWQGNLAGTPADVTQDVLEADLEEGPHGGAARIVLRNDDGRYNAPGASTLSALRPGSEIRVSPGYVTTAGPETVTGPSFYIQGWEYRRGPGSSTFILHARSPWGLLEQWWARRQYTWGLGEASAASILQFLLARAGVALDVSGASTICSTLAPAFTIHPGESGVSAVRRLLAMVPDVLLFQGLGGLLKNPQESDATDYAYGTDHVILDGRYVSTSLEVNRTQVYGQAGMAEAFDWNEVADVHDRLRQVHDLNLDTQQKVTDRAATELRHQVLSPLAGAVVVPTNCGQELYDVVEVTDASAGLSGARYRVQGIRWEYRRRRRAAYTQTVALSQP